MYKLLVVDDEFNSRDGLANTISWESIDVAVVGMAADGVEALKKIALLTPDIVITDVNMDNMNGLDLAEVIKQEYPLIKVIVVSGYDEFDYVRRALELRIHSYILKPVRSRELLEVVRNVIGEIEAARRLKARIDSLETVIERNRALLTEGFLFDLLRGNIENGDELQARQDFLGIRFDRAYYTCLLMVISDHQAIIRDYGYRKLQSLTVSVLEIAGDLMSGYEVRPLIGEHGGLTLLIGGDAPDACQFRQCLTKELERLVENVTGLLGVNVTAIVGDIYQNALALSKSFREASLALEHNALAGQASIVHIGDVPAIDGSQCIYPIDKENLLLRSLANADEIEISDIITELFAAMESRSYTRNRMRTDLLGLLGLISRKAMDLGVDPYQLYNQDLLDPYTALERYDSLYQLKDWFQNIVSETVRAIRNQRACHIKSVIKKAHAYMAGNYANANLSLVTIADHLHLSPSYFSRLYKKETGANYVEVLTNIRLEKAKILLKETNDRIAAISASVGYTDPKYFCTLFRKCEGLTPVEFREA